MHGPIAIIGMHRSGTTAIARALQGLGLHIGRDLDGNAESRVFQHANAQLLCLSGARWDMPDALEPFLRDRETFKTLAESAASYFSSARAARRYLGRRASLFHRNLFRLEFPWGWKDPRTTPTLPLWSKVFPGIRVIHVKRHGVDVAASLLARKKAMVRKTIESAAQPSNLWTRASCPDAAQWFDDLGSGLALWHSYERAAARHMANLGESRCISVRFEDVLEEPETQLRKLASFCKLEPEPQIVAEAGRSLDRSRRYAFLTSSALRDAAAGFSRTLAELGYGDHPT